MSAELNHTIVMCRDKASSAAFLAEVLGLPAPARLDPFHVVTLDNGVALDYLETRDEIRSQHYAFLIGDEDFNAVHERVLARMLDIWADPGRRRRGQTYDVAGARGFYFDDPDGHLLEVLARSAGGGT